MVMVIPTPMRLRRSGGCQTAFNVCSALFGIGSFAIVVFTIGKGPLW